jgi:hypothetical protein
MAKSIYWISWRRSAKTEMLRREGLPWNAKESFHSIPKYFCRK